MAGDDERLLAELAERAQPLLVPLLARPEAVLDGDAPELADLAAADPQDLLAVLLTLLTPISPDRAGLPPGLIRIGATDRARDDIVDRLRRRRLPWTPATAGLALRLTALSGVSVWSASVALAAAEQVTATHPGAPDVCSGLEVLSRRLAAEGDHVFDVPRLRAWARRLVAAQVPEELIDLGFLTDGDGWAPFVRGTVADAATGWPGAPALVELLREPPRGPAPTAAWRRRAASVAGDPPTSQLLRTVLDALVVVPPRADGLLLDAGNDDTARAAVWISAGLVDVAWRAPLLGDLAVRCAAPTGVPTDTRARCAKVARAAIDVLAETGGPDARAGLQRIWEDLSRRDLLLVVASALDLSPEVVEPRLEALRRVKQRAVRAIRDPAPVRAQSEATASLRRGARPTLVAIGFDDISGRTYRRHVHHDGPARTDVVFFAAGRHPCVRLGTWYVAAHPDAGPGERRQLRELALDVRVQLGPTEEELSGDPLAAHLLWRLVEHGLPLLDLLGDPDATLELLTSGAPLFPAGHSLTVRETATAAVKRVLAGQG